MFRFIINWYCDIKCYEININIESDINSELSRDASVLNEIITWCIAEIDCYIEDVFVAWSVDIFVVVLVRICVGNIVDVMHWYCHGFVAVCVGSKDDSGTYKTLICDTLFCFYWQKVFMITYSFIQYFRVWSGKFASTSVKLS